MFSCVFHFVSFIAFNKFIKLSFAARFMLQVLVVWAVHKMSPERGRPRVGAPVLAQSMPTPLLPIVPSRGPHFGPPDHRPAGVGRGLLYHGGGCGPRRPVVQYCAAQYLRSPGRMAVSDVYDAGAGGDATGWDCL